MRKMFTSVLAILLLSTGFVAWTFARFFPAASRAWMAIPLVLIAGFVPTVVLSRRTRSRALTALNVASGISVGFLTYFLMAAIACWCAAAVARIAGVGLDRPAVGVACFGAATLVGSFALFTGNWLRVTRVSVPLKHLPEYWRGRTIALVSDVHLGNFRGVAFSRRVVSRLRGLHPECILIGGDLFDGVKVDVERVLGPWSALSAPSGVFFVGGNHDDYGGRRMYFDAVRKAGITVLDNERVVIHGLQLIGIHDRETHRPEVFRALLQKSGLEPGRASVLLAHRPSNLEVPEEAGIGLQLSGHTHGGQFWPWTLFAQRVHGEFTYGLRRLGRMRVFTSSGAGTWGPPLRLGTRSEVVLIRLESE